MSSKHPVWVALVALLASGAIMPALAAKPKPAELKISGNGWLGDWQLKRLLRTTEAKELKAPLLEANVIEDCALLLLSQLRKEGFLRATLRVDLTLDSGRTLRVVWNESIEPPLPRPLSARKVHFHVQRGIRYYYHEVTFTGLTRIKLKRARSYFVETGTLLPLKSSRIYNPENLKRGLASLAEVLNRQGYQDATATAGRLEQNDRTGAVNVRIDVKEGPRYLVQSVRVERYAGETNRPAEVRLIETNRPYSRFWEQDFTQQLKTTNYHRGYPDTAVTLQGIHSNEVPGAVYVDLLATVKPGPQVRVGQVEFTGAKRTRESVMESRVPLEPGQLLDRTKADEGRNRLARLGIFDSVTLHYDPVDEHTHNVIYDVKEGKVLNVSLLFGIGSYELLRGGVEVQENNIFGRAHSARLRAVQSFKASRGEFTYTIPDLLGKDIDVFALGSALRRQEITFTREEYGGGVGLHRFFPAIATDVTGRYNYQVLNALSLGSQFAPVGPTNAGVGSVIAQLRHDRLDNPLYPRRGYKLSTTVELASQYLGGDVTFERVEMEGAFHHPLAGGLGLNLGLSHGFVVSPGPSETDVPFNKRFFPGGAYSIRGYQEGEAGPRNAQGKLIGVETYLLGSVELEQALTRTISVVVFSDSLGFAQHIQAYPFNQALYSVGGGVRLRTIIGPVRLEYGHNLNPGPQDPSGTFQFSLGFPF